MTHAHSPVQRSPRPATQGIEGNGTNAHPVQAMVRGMSFDEGAAALAPRPVQQRRRGGAPPPAPVESETGEGEAEAAAGEGEAAPAAGPAGTIERQMNEQGGIRIVLAKNAPTGPEKAASIAAQYRGKPLSALIARYRSQIEHMPSFRALLGDPNPDRILGAGDPAFGIVGGCVAGNDRAFGIWGAQHARNRDAIGPGLAVGRAVHYAESEDPLLALQGIAVAAREQMVALHPDQAATAPGPAPAETPAEPTQGATSAAPASAGSGAEAAPQEAAPTPPPAPPAPRGRGRRRRAPPRPKAPLASTRNVAELAIFTHGWHDGVALGAGAAAGNVLATRLGPACAPSVNVQLYACSAAGKEDSFAEKLAAGLAREGHDARVFGHTSSGRADTNLNGRELVARAGESEAHATSNYGVVFDAAYLEAQKRQLATALAGDGHDEAAVDGALREVAPGWFRSAMFRVRVAARAPDGRQESAPRIASMAIGYARAETIAAVRAEWEKTDQGLAAVREKLTRRGPRPRLRRPARGGAGAARGSGGAHE